MDPASLDLSDDLNLAVDAETRSQIAEAARSLVGAPFRHQGRAKATGIDCSGLAIMSGRMVGLPCIEMEADYRRVPSFRDFARSLPSMVIRVPGGLDAVEIGDVLLVGVGRRRLPIHCCVVVGRPESGLFPLDVVHSVEGRGCVLDRVFPDRAANILDVWRYRRV